jgi:2',3'-cyclic-nucleotide 2'-phosphodiesterase (5'-nucleotidase family)
VSFYPGQYPSTYSYGYPYGGSRLSTNPQTLYQSTISATPQPVSPQGQSSLSPGFGQPVAYSFPKQSIGNFKKQAANKAETTEVRIIYNNDPHKKFMAMPGLVSGFNYFTKEGEQQGQDILRLNGGDNHVAKNSRDWEINVLLMNLLNLHGTAMGNHELDQGSASYSKGLLRANFKTFVSNLKLSPSNPINTRIYEGRIKTQSEVVQCKNGQYGLLGVTTPELASVASQAILAEGIQVQSFEETCRIVQEEVARLEQKGVNKIILLSHMGYALDKKLAKKVHGIDVIVGGHSHDILKGIVPEFTEHQTGSAPRINLVSSSSGEPVLILQAGKDGRWFGVADVAFDQKGLLLPHQNKLYNPYKFPKDQQATAINNYFLGPPKPLATIVTDYRNKNIPFKPDPVAEFTADAVRRLSGADIGFVRSPEIRNNIPPGLITDQDLEALMPFGDPLVRFTATGEEILGALKRSGQGLKIKDGHPGMLHPSGLAFRVNQKSGEVGPVYVQNRNRPSQPWEPLDFKKVYTVAMGEFTVKNPLEFPEFSHPERIHWNSQMPLKSVFQWGLQQAGAPWRPIQFQTDGRLRVD